MPTPRAPNAQILAGRYRVVRDLGSGGMASVLLAEDERLGRQVAIKRLPTSSPEDALARFRREARLGASLNHPNVVSIYDSTTDDDSLLIVMEYVEGESLKDKLRSGPLPSPDVTSIVSQIASALDYAHAAGVIHRDVKPSNVLIAPDGTAKLADLGIATATDATSITTANDIIGTLSYIAPERLESAPDDSSADVFSLAAVAFEALSGQKAQPGRTPTEIVTGRPLDLVDAWPQGPAAVAEVLRQGMARDPAQRPGSAGELADRLSTALAEEPATTVADPEATTALPPAAPVAAPPLPPPEHRSDPGGGGRRRWIAVGAVLAALAGVVAAAFALGGGEDDPPRVQTKVQTVTEKPNTTTPEPEPEPLTGAALGTSLNDEGFALLSAGDYAGAVSTLQEAVGAFEDAGATDDINYAYALFNLGKSLRLAGRPEEAIPVLEQRLQFNNQRGVVARELALAQEASGQTSSGGTLPPGQAKKEDSSGPGDGDEDEGGGGSGGISPDD